MKSMTWADVWRRRLDRSHLLRPARPADLELVVIDACGVQAQILAAAELALSARVSVTRGDVQRALWEERRIVKIPSLRSTIHLHAAEDVPLWIAAIRAVGWWREPRFLRNQGATLEQMLAVNDAARDALDGRALTRRELESEVLSRVGAWARKDLGWKPFAQTTSLASGLIAPWEARIGYGPNRGNEVTFIRMEQWLPRWNDLDPDEALREAARRYLRAYGPARADDFAHWFHATPAQGRAVFESLRDVLEDVDIEGYRAFMLRGERMTRTRAQSAVRLVPDYDCYIIGAGPPGEARRRLVPPEAGERVFNRGAGPFAAVLVDGIVAGAWKRRSSARRVTVDVQPFRRLLPQEQEGVSAEAERIGAFYELPVELAIARPERARSASRARRACAR